MRKTKKYGDPDMGRGCRWGTLTANLRVARDTLEQARADDLLGEMGMFKEYLQAVDLVYALSQKAWDQYVKEHREGWDGVDS